MKPSRLFLNINNLSLDTLTELVESDLSEVNDVIVQRMSSPVNLISQLANHIISAGGKRLRPMLTLNAAKLCNYGLDKRHIRLAACVEFDCCSILSFSVFICCFKSVFSVNKMALCCCSLGS